MPEADENSGPTSSSPAFSGSFQTVLTTPRRRTPPPPTTLPHSSAQGPAPLAAQGPAPPDPHDAAAQPGPHDAARQRRRAPSPTPPKVPRRSAPTTPPRSPAPTTPPASSRAPRRRAELLRPHDAACTPPLQSRPSPPAPARRAPRPCTPAEPHARPAEPHVAAHGPRALARPRRREPAVREGSPWPPSRRREPAIVCKIVITPHLMLMAVVAAVGYHTTFDAHGGRGGRGVPCACRGGRDEPLSYGCAIGV
eukprot:XP_020393572.1 vegetative cell wall protein gp1-like [Zea mays]